MSQENDLRLLARATQRMLTAFEDEVDAMAYTDGYEKVTPGDKPPYAAPGTETSNAEKGPGPDFARRPAKGGSKSD